MSDAEDHQYSDNQQNDKTQLVQQMMEEMFTPVFEKLQQELTCIKAANHQMQCQIEEMTNIRGNNQIQNQFHLEQRSFILRNLHLFESCCICCFNWLSALFGRACIYLKNHMIISILILLLAISTGCAGYLYFQNDQPLVQSKDGEAKETSAWKINAEQTSVEYLRHLDRHLTIDKALWDYEEVCHSEAQKHKEETQRKQTEADEIQKMLSEKCGEASKYSKEYIQQELGKHYELEVDIAKRENYQKCMDEQIEQLKTLRKNKSVIKWYAEHDTFKWGDMMYKEGLCEDPSKCLCKILLKSNRNIERRIEKSKTLNYDPIPTPK
eukprot:25200_1